MSTSLVAVGLLDGDPEPDRGYGPTGDRHAQRVKRLQRGRVFRRRGSPGHRLVWPGGGQAVASVRAVTLVEVQDLDAIGGTSSEPTFLAPNQRSWRRPPRTPPRQRGASPCVRTAAADSVENGWEPGGIPATRYQSLALAVTMPAGVSAIVDSHQKRTHHDQGPRQ